MQIANACSVHIQIVMGFNLWQALQQTTSLGRLRQIDTKSVSVCLYTEQACCGSPSWHLGSSAFNYRLQPLQLHDHYSLSVYGSETHINPPPLVFGELFCPHDGLGVICVQTVANSPLALVIPGEGLSGWRFTSKLFRFRLSLQRLDT